MINKDESKIIIVPWDFTRISEYALEYAINAAHALEKEIFLLHIVNKDATKEQEKEALKRLEKQADEILQKYQIQVQPVVRKGSIFNVISDYASEVKAALVVMGTHGVTGTQKITGSWALKVIIGSKVPFLVVQEKPGTAVGFNKIVYPVDFKGENKEQLQWAIYFGKYFNSKIYLFKRPFRDSSLLKKTNTNLNFAIRFLRQNNLEYEIVEAPGKISFDRETIQFAVDIKADLIIIITSRHFTFLDYLFGNREQRMLSNPSNIPVLCVNPHATSAGVGQFMWGST